MRFNYLFINLFIKIQKATFQNVTSGKATFRNTTFPIYI